MSFLLQFAQWWVVLSALTYIAWIILIATLTYLAFGLVWLDGFTPFSVPAVVTGAILSFIACEEEF